MWLVLWIVTMVRKLIQKEEDQGMNTLYGDGTVISDADMENVRDAVWKNLVAYPWKEGDIVMVDNRFVSHGRLPYSGPRSIIVAWG
jgi:alpha-ketoglutarate-dependent taurine dioxygenase